MVVSSMVTSISSISETSPISLSIDIVSAPSISHVKVTVSSGPTVFSEASNEMISGPPLPNLILSKLKLSKTSLSVNTAS